MNFSICIIAKNEANTLPRLFESLSEFRSKGGEICLLDTGSKDNTAKIAESYGAKVFHKSFKLEINFELAKQINKKFHLRGDQPILESSVSIFDFASARNYINSMASNDMICTLDADEAYTTFDIDKINKFIEEGYEQFEYQFVYAHDQFGKPAVQFIQSKFFNREKAHWTGIVHEVVTGQTKHLYLDESIIKLEHFQEPGKDHRSNYLPGLAYDCFMNPTKDRQSHYFARELMYSDRYRSAIKEFQRHTEMNGWLTEKAQSMIYMGDCYGKLNEPQMQAGWYSASFYTDSSRRAALISLALFYQHNDNKLAASAYAQAALQIPFFDYYANEKSHYENLPHEILYWAKGWLGDIESAKEHLTKALEYQPYNQNYLRDTKFYFEYPDNGIDGWMRFPELQWLYKTAKKHTNIVEVGSWKGKSTHALLTGQIIGTVTAIDTWQGSKDIQDMTNALAKQEDVYKTFRKNVGYFENLKIIRKSSVEAAKDFQDGSIDFLFIDAGHTKEEVKEDAKVWLPKMKPNGLISGHDYQPDVWMGVCEAVDEIFGKPDGVCDSIWWVDLSKRNYTVKKETTLIPKKIYTAWFSDDPMPDKIKKLIDSQKIPGYDHVIFTLDNVHYINNQYFMAAISSKKWVKATDWIRMDILSACGGIFLDADVEVIEGKNFDHLLNEQMFVGKEVNNQDGSIVLGTAVMGSQPNHPLFVRWIKEVERDFKGDDDFYYESSMHILNKIGVDFQDQMKILEPSILYPYNWQDQRLSINPDSITIHKFMKSWIRPKIVFEEMFDAIGAGTNFIFVKRGDGEEACMDEQHGENCDGVKYSHNLANDLIDAFDYFKSVENCFVVKFEDQKNYNILLHRDDNDPSVFWKKVIASNRSKYFIGPNRLSEMAVLLNAPHIIISNTDAYNQIDGTLDIIPIEENAIYIFSAGLAAKIMIYEMHKRNPNATYIDAGSAFDPLVRMTRTDQISTEQFKAIYFSKQDNFNIPQETHPERLWVVKQLYHADTILDLGCGTNKTVPEAIGADIRPVTDLQISIDSLPLEDKYADCIISRHSFEHILNPTKTMKEWMRVLRDNSKMLIVLPDHGSIDTIDPYYSAGQHVHAYSMDTFKDFISLFPELWIEKQEVVMKDWSFGTTIHHNLPRIAIVIPNLGRPDGLERLKNSIGKLNYPKHLLKLYIVEGEASVPVKMDSVFKKSTEPILCYAANDMWFTPDSLLRAVEKTKYFGLVSFNAGLVSVDHGNICEHFVITRDLVNKIGGQIFDTRLHHCGVDNLLWAKAQKLNQAFWCEQAVICHAHFSRGGTMDEVYEKGWSKMAEDREKLKELIKEI